MWAGKILRRGYPLQHQRIDLLVEKRCIRRGRAPRARPRALAFLQIRFASELSTPSLARNVVVEYRLLTTNAVVGRHNRLPPSASVEASRPRRTVAVSAAPQPDREPAAPSHHEQGPAG